MQLAGILNNIIQEYAWGSHTAIPELLGTPVSDKPQAELWMGAHPKAPSRVLLNGKWEPLDKVIAGHPVEILGEAVSERFDNQLPYLFKVLAAAKPLSIQAHPDAQQAKDGFMRENRLQIPLTSPLRNFRDDHHKPECLCALTRFWAMNGFRFVPDTTRYLKTLCPDALQSGIRILEQSPDADGLRRFMQSLLTMAPEEKSAAISQAVSIAEVLSAGSDSVYAWILRLYDAYPSDIGVLSPAFLNLICLEPEQAVFLPAGEPHAYLEGVGIELMANSDNVLRGGLTSKHVDVPELLRTLTFRSCSPSVLLPRKYSETEWVYETPAAEFCLSQIRITEKQPHTASSSRSVDILLCTAGNMTITGADSHDHPLVLDRGKSAMLPAIMGSYRLQGNGVCYKASTPV